MFTLFFLCSRKSHYKNLKSVLFSINVSYCFKHVSSIVTLFDTIEVKQVKIVPWLKARVWFRELMLVINHAICFSIVISCVP